MNFGVISLFPEMFAAVSDYGISSRAVESGQLQLHLWNPRDFTEDVHRTVDDRPYGGGPGMIMQAGPLQQAIYSAQKALPDAKVAYLSPQGKVLDQAAIKQLSQRQSLILLCGRYEGIDERLIDQHVDEEWSIGDYVISGGELAAMVLIDSITRVLPGVLGHQDSASEDSFWQGLLDCPHYTRPEQWQGLSVPEVLQNGNHEAIRRWRLQQSLGRTWLRRPELLAKQNLTEEQQQLLTEFKKQLKDEMS